MTRKVSAAWNAGTVSGASAGGKTEGSPAPQTGATTRTTTAFSLVSVGVAGTGFEPV